MIWRRSSYCDTGTCLEVAFRVASACDTGGCVAVAIAEDDVLVRDSKEVDGPVLRFTPGEWAAFLVGAKAGEFDRHAA